jgi:hypothetical protein
MKNYSTPDGKVTFHFNRSARKWEFKITTKEALAYSVFLEIPNGAEGAHKVALTMSKTAAGKTMTNATRHNIKQILAAQS